MHHDTKGKRYKKLSQMSQSLIEAAKLTGIDITLVPVYYAKGGFGEKLQAKQKRFGFKNTDEYYKLISELECNNGVGVHSLRAADPEEIKEIFRTKDKPKHIHIAEQIKEVKECELKWGQRPITWLANNVDLDSNCHLVHATHANQTELDAIAELKANVVICPSTEGNLGDGFFPLSDFLRINGKFSIGSDSQVTLSPMEELRWLDYGMRLQLQKRSCGSTADRELGDLFFCTTLESGSQGKSVAIKEGNPLTGVVFCSPAIELTSLNKLLSKIIYTADSGQIKGTITNGAWRVQNGVHHAIEEISKNYKSAIGKLKLF